MCLHLVAVTHTVFPTHGGQGQMDLCQFHVSLVYSARARAAKPTHRKTLSPNKQTRPQIEYFRTFIWDEISLGHELSVTQDDFELPIFPFAPLKWKNVSHRTVSS